VSTYAQAAEILGVSRQRVYQLVSLVTKLPDEVKEFLLRNDDPEMARIFTERRLRPLTQMVERDDQVACFRELLAASVNALGVTREDALKS